MYALVQNAVRQLDDSCDLGLTPRHEARIAYNWISHFEWVHHVCKPQLCFNRRAFKFDHSSTTTVTTAAAAAVPLLQLKNQTHCLVTESPETVLLNVTSAKFEACALQQMQNKGVSNDVRKMEAIDKQLSTTSKILTLSMAQQWIGLGLLENLPRLSLFLLSGNLLKMSSRKSLSSILCPFSFTVIFYHSICTMNKLGC